MLRLLSSRRRGNAFCLALLTLAVGLLALLPVVATAAAPAAGQFPYCSWWMTTTPETANVAFPDAAATYWTTPFLAGDGLSIEIDGTYPNARYMSFNVYDDEFGSFSTNGVSSGLADYLIAPSSGSVNPFQTSGAPGGAFSLTLAAIRSPARRTRCRWRRATPPPANWARRSATSSTAPTCRPAATARSRCRR